jgi:hypothetical protein
MIHIFFWALFKKKCIFTDASLALLVKFYEKHFLKKSAQKIL